MAVYNGIPFKTAMKEKNWNPKPLSQQASAQPTENPELIRKWDFEKNDGMNYIQSNDSSHCYRHS